MKAADPIYVEILIRAPLDAVWQLTQNPETHQRWDLRFTTIVYLPRENSDAPQRFNYATRIGFGLKIEGNGESVGERESVSGARSSSLKFWSEDPKSLIREGSGFWKYIPTPEGVRFLTRYDYQVRFGAAGRLLDRLVFRPIMGWATAWSFDRLRLWAETGAPPEPTFRLAAAHALARCALAVAWFWHGLVPKLLIKHPDEARMLTDGGVSQSAADLGVIAAGFGEMGIALWLLLRWQSRAPLFITLVLMPLALAGVAMNSPDLLRAPFNPFTLNLLMCSTAGIALLTQRWSPSARACQRKPEKPAP